MLNGMHCTMYVVCSEPFLKLFIIYYLYSMLMLLHVDIGNQTSYMYTMWLVLYYEILEFNALITL